MFKEVSLVYFSSTKTTQRTVRAIGRALAKAFDIPVQEYDFTLPNARSRKLHFASDQLVVVGSPVYGGVMPLLVREYLAQYVTGEKTACILAAVYGNRNFDDCLVEMQDLMEENGFVVTAAAACIGEHSYSTAIASGRPNAQDLALAEEFGRQVAQKLSASPAVPTLAQTLPGCAFPDSAMRGQTVGLIRKFCPRPLEKENPWRVSTSRITEMLDRFSMKCSFQLSKIGRSSDPVILQTVRCRLPFPAPPENCAHPSPSALAR